MFCVCLPLCSNLKIWIFVQYPEIWSSFLFSQTHHLFCPSCLLLLAVTLAETQAGWDLSWHFLPENFSWRWRAEPKIFSKRAMCFTTEAMAILLNESQVCDLLIFSTCQSKPERAILSFTRLPILTQSDYIGHRWHCCLGNMMANKGRDGLRSKKTMQWINWKPNFS